MFRFLARFLGLVCLAIACIMAVLDLARSIALDRMVLTPLQKSWSDTEPTSLEALKNAVEGFMPALWDPVLVSLLDLPGFVVFAALALLLYMLGYRGRKKAAIGA